MMVDGGVLFRFLAWRPLQASAWRMVAEKMQKHHEMQHVNPSDRPRYAPSSMLLIVMILSLGCLRRNPWHIVD